MTARREDAAAVNDDRRGVPILVGAILLAAVAAALFLTNLMRAPDKAPSASFPAEANGLDVITVADAIAILAADNSDDIAVSGWFQVPAPLGCPMPLQPTTLLDADCSIDATWLMAEPESLIHVRSDGWDMTGPTGPAVNVVFDGANRSWEPISPQRGDSVPIPVAFIGHFDDARAVGCRPENHQLCLDRLVVTVVAWADGVDFP